MVFTTLLIDQSGSMCGMEAQVVRAANKFVEQLAVEPVDQRIALSKFEDRLEPVRPFAPLGTFAPLTDQDYAPCGGTALYDSLDETIRTMGQKVDPEGRGVVAVITDGQDTSSRVSPDAIRATMDRLRDTKRWAFFFLTLDNDYALADYLQNTLGLPAQDVIAGRKGELGAAMKQITAKVRGYLTA